MLFPYSCTRSYASALPGRASATLLSVLHIGVVSVARDWQLWMHNVLRQKPGFAGLNLVLSYPYPRGWVSKLSESGHGRKAALLLSSPSSAGPWAPQGLEDSNVTEAAEQLPPLPEHSSGIRPPAGPGYLVPYPTVTLFMLFLGSRSQEPILPGPGGLCSQGTRPGPLEAQGPHWPESEGIIRTRPLRPKSGENPCILGLQRGLEGPRDPSRQVPAASTTSRPKPYSLRLVPNTFCRSGKLLKKHAFWSLFDTVPDSFCQKVLCFSPVLGIRLSERWSTFGTNYIDFLMDFWEMSKVVKCRESWM